MEGACQSLTGQPLSLLKADRPTGQSLSLLKADRPRIEGGKHRSRVGRRQQLFSERSITIAAWPCDQRTTG